MADSISIKDNKMQKFESKRLGRKNQERADKEIRGMEAEVDSGSRSSRLKKLSAAKKKEMLEEYESIIKKLKELELRNKKKQDFKHSFKGLKYFPTLNGHSVYSESMHVQEKNDKDSISAMMAYGQLGAGFDVTFEQMVQHIRPERRQEFLALCKNNSVLSHNLMGMTKVLQFYNQRDFTRAYAAMVFFGLENNIDLMETFLKVKFNADFKQQVNVFKEQIENASAYEVKAIREEAGTNVFSQHDAISTAMESSATGKSVAHNITEKAYKSLNKSEKTYKLVAPEMKDYKQKQVEIEIAEKLDIYEKSKTMFETTAERRDYIIREITTMKVFRAEAAMMDFRNKYDEYEEQLLKKDDLYVSSHTPIIRFTNDNFKKYKEIFLGRAGSRIQNKSQRIGTKPSNADLIESAKATGDTTAIEDAQREAFSNVLDNAGQFEQTIGFKINLLDEKLGQLAQSLRAAEESGNAVEVERLNAQMGELQQKRDQLSVTNQQELGGVDFEALLQTYKTDKNGLKRQISRYKEKLSKTTDVNKQKELLSCIDRLEKALEELTSDPKGVARAALDMQNVRLIDILTGNKSFGQADFDLLSDVLTVEKFNALTGENFTKKQFQEMKESHFYQVDRPFNIVDEKLLEQLLTEKMGKIYVRHCAIAEEGVTYQQIAEDLTETLDGIIAELDIELHNIEQEIETTTDAEKKNALTEKKEDIERRIRLVSDSKEIVDKKRGIKQEKEIKEQENKNSQEVINAEKTINKALSKMKNRLTTKIDGERRYVDTLKPDEIPEKLKPKTFMSMVTTVFDAIERIDKLNLISIKTDYITEVRSNLDRAVRILDSIKDKISEEDFEALKARQNEVTSKVEILESKAGEKTTLPVKSSEPEEVENAAGNETGRKSSTEAESASEPDNVGNAAENKTGSKSSTQTANSENNGFEATLEEFKNDRKGLQRFLSNYKKNLEKAIASGEGTEKITELQERIKIIEERISQLLILHKARENNILAEKRASSQEQSELGQGDAVVEVSIEDNSPENPVSNPTSGADALFIETIAGTEHVAGQTGKIKEEEKEGNTLGNQQPK